MATGSGSARDVWKGLEGLFRFGTLGSLDDAELLGRFVDGGRGESAEAAFAAMVERHGPMVLGVCRRVLGNRHEAEDAFQATFLILARKARWIARPEQLASWLHGVALRTARDARHRDDRRRARERKASLPADAVAPPDNSHARDELRAIVDEELARLPAAYRGPVILCELDGLSRRSAAVRLGISEGTLSSRLARARGLLRDRLARRGLAPSASTLAILARPTRAVLIPPTLAEVTITAAARVAAGTSLAGAAAAPVVTLTQGALNAMLFAKVKGVAYAVASVAVVSTGVGVLAQAPDRGARPRTPPSSDARPEVVEEKVERRDRPGRGSSRDDRLDALERKLDRILEALGSNRPVVPPGLAAMEIRSVPAPAAPRPPAPPSLDVAVPDRPPGAPPVAPAPPPAVTLPHVISGVVGGAGGLAAPPSLEGRVAELERRLTALQNRLDSPAVSIRRLDQRQRPDQVPNRAAGQPPIENSYHGDVTPVAEPTPPVAPRTSARTRRAAPEPDDHSPQPSARRRNSSRPAREEPEADDARSEVSRPVRSAPEPEREEDIETAPRRSSSRPTGGPNRAN